MGSRRPLPLTNPKQRYIAGYNMLLYWNKLFYFIQIFRVSRGWLIFKIPLCFGAWLSGSFAIYMQRFAIFPIVFVFNILLGITVFLAHVSASRRVSLHLSLDIYTNNIFICGIIFAVFKIKKFIDNIKRKFVGPQSRGNC